MAKYKIKPYRRLYNTYYLVYRKHWFWPFWCLAFGQSLGFESVADAKHAIRSIQVIKYS